MDIPLHPRADPWKFALEELAAGRRPVLVFVVDHSGSVPGVTGAVAVASEHGLAGTIGGGVAEKELLDRARVHNGPPTVVPFRHVPDEGGTLCSGEQRFVLMELTPREEPELASLVQTLEGHRAGLLHLTAGGLRFEPGRTGAHAFAATGPGAWAYSGPLGLVDTMTIVGGGHVSLALSRVMATLPFRVAVLDNRSDLPTMAANEHAHECRLVDFEAIAEEVEEGDRSWVVIMTFGHEHDRRVLEQLLGRRYAYLGLMGSRAKIAHMFADMRAAGVPAEHLEAVRAPIGLPIGSHTPEEIAVSIAAEIIAVRNGAEARWPASSSR